MNPNNQTQTNPSTMYPPQAQNTLNITDQDKEMLSKVMVIRSVGILHPISPIEYNIQARAIEKTILHLHGVTKTVEDIGVKTIDKVDIEQGIFFGNVKIVHMDQSEIHIDSISKSNAINIKNFFEQVIDFQRRNVVNVTGD
jgi:hypothetical protein